MLKGNLATRPFYNERLVTIAIAALAAAVLLLTAFNAVQLVTLARERAAHRERLNAVVSETERVRAEAEALQGSVDRVALTRLASSAREANQLIDRRTFSWTELLGQLEHTLPANVRLLSVSPRVSGGTFRITMAIIARDLANVEDFMEALRETGRFYDVAPIEQRLADEGAYRAVVEATLLPEQAPIAQEAPR